jgi:hypothetical protein
LIGRALRIAGGVSFPGRRRRRKAGPAQCRVSFAGRTGSPGISGAGLVEGLPIHGVVTLLSRELAHAEPGRQTVLDRLLDVRV